MTNFGGNLEVLVPGNEAKFIRQNHLNYPCGLLGSVSNNPIGKQKYVPLWNKLKDDALFTAGWENRISEQLRFKDREQKVKETYHDIN